MTNNFIAKEFLYHCWAGMSLVGFEDRELVWLGTEKNWNVLGWFVDGVYENEPDLGKAKAEEYLLTEAITI